jgi:hypothetical protein
VEKVIQGMKVGINMIGSVFSSGGEFKLLGSSGIEFYFY